MRATVGVLHPGAMGATVGAAAASAGAEVFWVEAGRSEATRRRAAAAGLSARPDLASLVAASGALVSVCPPAAAADQAAEVAGHGFTGLYIDANAIAPATADAVRERVEGAGARFVDGGIIGPPAETAGSTRLYLSGTSAREAADLFAGSSLEAVVIGERPGAASAVKMAYAAYTKGGSALLLAVRALAAAAGDDVERALLAEWELSQPGLRARSEQAARANAGKAWRFDGEMQQIAATFAAHGLPDGFHRAAGQLYRALAGFKRSGSADLAQVVDALLRR